MFDISKLTLRQKIGQMIGLAFHGTTYNENLKTQIEDIQAGLIIYFKDNCHNPKQIYDLNKEINKHSIIPPFIALDQEGGMVARVTTGITQSPGAMAISACSNSDYAYTLAYNMGVELRSIGFNYNFAPDGDVNNNPSNPVINVRSYSDKPEIVSEYVYKSVQGYKDAKLMTSIKHYPGHGDTSVDSHVGLPVVDYDMDRLKAIELVPFMMAKDKDLPGIMASHVMYSKYDSFPATLSKVLITDILRNDIGYNGLVVTDSLTMNAVWGRYPLEEIVERTFNSGCDIMLICGARAIESQKEFFETAVRLCEEGRISIDIVNESVSRILKYKEEYEVGKMISSFDEVLPLLEKKSSMDFAYRVAKESITLLKDENNLLPIKQNDKTLVVFPKIKVVTLVENDDNTLNSLADFMPYDTDKYYIDIDPASSDSEELVCLSKSYDKIIYCSYNACFNPNQAKLINRLNKDKLVVVAIRTPYDINVLEVKTYLCSYEASVLAFKALANALTKEKPTGKLPVALKK